MATIPRENLSAWDVVETIPPGDFSTASQWFEARPPVPHATPSSSETDSTTTKTARELECLRELQAHHSFWNNALFRAFQSGYLTPDDLQFIFGQYSFYCRNFTRYLAALMANTDNDLHRAQLVENLWEESGAAEVSQRHAELFRRFLTQGLQLALDELSPAAVTQVFVHEVLSFCSRSPACEGAAFLSLGTESLVPRMYEIFLQGLTAAGIPEQHLTFFQLHIACDDEHAITLEQMMLSHADEPDWFVRCQRALTMALDLREQFFEGLYQQLQVHRIQLKLERIQARKSLASDQQQGPHQTLKYGMHESGTPLYENQLKRGLQDIDFRVERLEIPSEVLDPRLVCIAPHKTNERHRHAHEALFLVKQGQGMVWIDQEQFSVEVGDIVFVPRWAAHQVKNTGETPFLMVAITDFGLTRQAFIGHYLETARMNQNRDTDYADPL